MRKQSKEDVYSVNLREFLREDYIYQKYLKDKEFKPNDFEKQCIQHCVDIELALETIYNLNKCLAQIKKRKVVANGD